MIRSGNVNVWVATSPVDMRRSFDGLAEHVRAFPWYQMAQPQRMGVNGRSAFFTRWCTCQTRGIHSYFAA